MTIKEYPEHLILENRLESLEQIKPWLEQTLADCKLPNDLCFEMALCIYEAVANIIVYAYSVPDGYSLQTSPVVHMIEIRLILHADAIEITIRDDGGNFNPLMTPEKKIAETISEATLSGRGIPLMRGLSDKLTYRRADGYNFLSILKRIGNNTG